TVGLGPPQPAPSRPRRPPRKAPACGGVEAISRRLSGRGNRGHRGHGRPAVPCTSRHVLGTTAKAASRAGRNGSRRHSWLTRLDRSSRCALLPWSRKVLSLLFNWNALRESFVMTTTVGAARVPTKENPLAIALVPTPFSAFRDGVHP